MPKWKMNYLNCRSSFSTNKVFIPYPSTYSIFFCEKSKSSKKAIYFRGSLNVTFDLVSGENIRIYWLNRHFKD